MLWQLSNYPQRQTLRGSMVPACAASFGTDEQISKAHRGSRWR